MNPTIHWLRLQTAASEQPLLGMPNWTSKVRLAPFEPVEPISNYIKPQTDIESPTSLVPALNSSRDRIQNDGVVQCKRMLPAVSLLFVDDAAIVIIKLSETIDSCR